MSEKTTTSIISLKAENIKRIKAVEIIPHGATVVIGGRNAQGKTSVLDCIAMALGGAASAPSEPIRRGASKAQIILETEELIVTRKFSKSGTTLEVTNKDGLKFAGPQGVLDKLVSTLAFDPLAFVMADKKAQFKQLQNLLGIDTESIDIERKTEFDRRTQKNRDKKALAAVIDGLPMTGPARVEVKELLDELSRAEQINAGVNDLEREAGEAENGHANANQLLTNAIAKVAEIERELLHAKEMVRKCDATVDIAKNALLTAQERAGRAERVEIAPIKERIAAAEDTNAAAAKVEDRKRKQADLTVLENESEMMTAKLAELDQKRAKLLSDCPMPVPGIGFEADGVTLNDLPLDQASAAEQLKLGLAVACAMNPNLRVMLIRNGSLLDDDAMALVAKMAEDHGAQVWIERVGNDGKCTVVIEDGEVSSPPAGEGLPVKDVKPAETPAAEPAPAPAEPIVEPATIEKPAAPVAAIQVESLY